MGAMGMANFAQTFYYSGTLPITNMPEVGRGAAAGQGGRAGQMRTGEGWGEETEEMSQPAIRLV